MENASKALVIAGEVLITLLVMAGLVFLYRNSGGLFSTVNSKINQQEIDNYNNPFTRLAGISQEATNSSNETVDSVIDIYEVVSIINYARDINNKLDNMDGISDSADALQKQNRNPNYINVIVNNFNGNHTDCSTIHQNVLNQWIATCSNPNIKYNFSFEINTYTDEGRVNTVTFKLK